MIQIKQLNWRRDGELGQQPDWDGLMQNTPDVYHSECLRQSASGRGGVVFLTQQGCMKEIMKHKGGQHYDIPHMKKKHLEMKGEPPITLQCPMELYIQSVQFVNE